MLPFLKWPGGKRWFVTSHADLLPGEFGRYIEPFLGGGAVFFKLRPKKATLGDVNRDVMDVYRGIRKDWRRLVRLLEDHQASHGERYYYEIRANEPGEVVERAARLIYLNRTCFNGIYRVNRDGVFNVPKGTRRNVLFPTDDFEGAARLLRTAALKVSDFQPLIDNAAKGDLVFVDPPYTVRHNQNAFIKYNEKLFSWEDQIRLAGVLANARQRGVRIVATNANHEHVRKLYEEKDFSLRVVSRFSSISAAAASRKQFEELVISAN